MKEIKYIYVDSARANQMLYKFLEDGAYGWVDLTLDGEYAVCPDYKVKYNEPMVFAIIYDCKYKNPNRFHQYTYRTCPILTYKYITVAEFLWDELADVIVDDDGNIESDWNIFEAGTNREYIWHFFENELKANVYELMHGKDEKSMYRTYYTLRRGKALEEEILRDADGNIVEFETYEEAFDQMVNIYKHSLYEKHYIFAENPIRYRIWETKVSGDNSMTQLA